MQFWRDTALPFVESRRADHSRACYQPHMHPTLSIGAVDAGHSHFSSGEQHWPLRPGSLVVVPAGCVHACNPAPGQAWSYQMLHLDAAWLAALLGPGQTLPTQAWVQHDAGAYQRFGALNHTLFSDAPTAHKQAALEHYLRAVNWCAGTAVTPPPASIPPGVARALAALHADPAAAWPLATLARAAGLSPQSLVRAFRRATGLTPHAYQLDLRIQAARSQLQQGTPLADAALELDFYDQSHFHQHFRQRVAATPRHYQRGHA